LIIKQNETASLLCCSSVRWYRRHEDKCPALAKLRLYLR